jgi:hypothetical protein
VGEARGLCEGHQRCVGHRTWGWRRSVGSLRERCEENVRQNLASFSMIQPKKGEVDYLIGFLEICLLIAEDSTAKSFHNL